MGSKAREVNRKEKYDGEILVEHTGNNFYYYDIKIIIVKTHFFVYSKGEHNIVVV